MDTLSREVTLSKLFLIHFQQGLLYKGRICSQSEQILSYRLGPFQKGLGVLGSLQEVTKVVSLVKMAENLPSVSSLPKQRNNLVKRKHRLTDTMI